MGYLVQNNFKNFFKDVRIRDLIYVENLESIKVIDPDWTKEVGPYLYFDTPEMAEAYAAALNAEVGEGFAKARYHGDAYYKELGGKYVTVWAVDCRLPLVKYWKLEDEKPLPKPTTVFMTPNHFLVNEKELRAIIQPIVDEFAKYEPDYNAGQSNEETDEYSNPRL